MRRNREGIGGGIWEDSGEGHERDNGIGILGMRTMERREGTNGWWWEGYRAAYLAQCFAAPAGCSASSWSPSARSCWRPGRSC